MRKLHSLSEQNFTAHAHTKLPFKMLRTSSVKKENSAIGGICFVWKIGKLFYAQEIEGLFFGFCYGRTFIYILVVFPGF